jgi:uncharacterized protein
LASKLKTGVVPLETVDHVAGWDEAVRAANAPVFYSSEFLKCVATAPLTETDSAALLVLDDETGFVAAVPVFRQARIDPLELLAPLRDSLLDLATSSGLIGHCWHCYDTRIVTVREAQPHRIVEVFERHARAVRAGYFGLVNVSDPMTLRIMNAAGITARHMTDRYVMDIEAYSSFDDYVAALQPNDRRELRRQYRRYESSAAELTVERHPFADIDEVVQLCRRTAVRYGAEFYYPQEPVRLLLAGVSSARLVSIRAGGERIGALICFVDGRRLHIWAAGTRYDRSAFSPYAIAIAEAIRFAIGERMSVIEGGRGNGRIKMKQGFSPLRLYACLRRVRT